MSQAEYLLDTMEEEGMESSVDFTDDPDIERHIQIGNDRIIVVPDELKRLGVRNDHNIETVTFDCIRRWDGADMSTMDIYVIYETSGALPEAYPVDKTKITIDADNDNVMHFDWVISGNVTRTPGPVAIQVCVKEINDDGSKKTHWSSEPNKDDCYVSDGLDCDAGVADSLRPDIVAGIIADVVDSVITSDELKNAIDSGVANRYTQAINDIIIALPLADHSSF